jgi:hypothetical protein
VRIFGSDGADYAGVKPLHSRDEPHDDHRSQVDAIKPGKRTLGLVAEIREG